MSDLDRLRAALDAWGKAYEKANLSPPTHATLPLALIESALDAGVAAEAEVVRLQTEVEAEIALRSQWWDVSNGLTDRLNEREEVHRKAYQRMWGTIATADARVRAAEEKCDAMDVDTTRALALRDEARSEVVRLRAGLEEAMVLMDRGYLDLAVVKLRALVRVSPPTDAQPT